MVGSTTGSKISSVSDSKTDSKTISFSGSDYSKTISLSFLGSDSTTISISFLVSDYSNLIVSSTRNVDRTPNRPPNFTY